MNGPPCYENVRDMPRARKKAVAKPVPPTPPKKILSIDIGGSHVKMLLLGETEPRRFESGPELTPLELVKQVKELARGWHFTAIALGYPGLVGDTGPLNEPGNLGRGWVGFDYATAFGCPVRVVNDAVMQALGSYEGGRMLFIGLGTGVGSVLIVNHALLPLELGELRYKKTQSYSERLSRRALDEVGPKKWRDRVLALVPSLQRAFLTDYVVLGGGNASKVTEPLPPNVRLGHNLTAFRGGYRLWGMEDVPTLHAAGDKSAGTRDPSPEWRLL